MFGVHSQFCGAAEIDMRSGLHHGHWKKPAHHWEECARHRAKRTAWRHSPN